MKRKSNNKGFTLVELIIVIAILAIIMLIATLAYGGIQQRMKIRSDKATCGEIGKALAVREADLDKSKGIQLYPTVVEYDSLGGVENYIKPGLTPQSMPDGGYIVTAIQTDTGKKIIVGIGKNDQEISTALYVDKDNAGWCWTEGKDIGKLIEENDSKFTPAKTLAGITGGEEGGSGEGGGSSVVAIMENSEVAVGSYIDYTGGDYTGKWVVLRNTGGTIEIISKESVGSLTLSGADGYANAVKTLNDKCATYVNSTYATSGRSAGATSSSIGQINTTDNPLTFVAARPQLPYYDEYYMEDMVNNINLLHSSNSGYVWLASRYLETNSMGAVFYVRSLSADGGIMNFELYAADNVGTAVIQESHGVRPVITLKSGIRIVGGSGSSDDPYTIGI